MLLSGIRMESPSKQQTRDGDEPTLVSQKMLFSTTMAEGAVVHGFDWLRIGRGFGAEQPKLQ